LTDAVLLEFSDPTLYAGETREMTDALSAEHYGVRERNERFRHRNRRLSESSSATVSKSSPVHVSNLEKSGAKNARARVVTTPA
jgi:hypothetical protein